MSIKPLLRWAGGKRWLCKSIDSFLPENFNNYYEPFFGGGSVYFWLKSNNRLKKKSTISDCNSHLINFYIQIKNHPLKVIEKFRLLIPNDPVLYRSLCRNIPYDEVDQAVRFLYLNHNSYNGLYRVNLNGEYNVPFAYRNEKMDVEKEIFKISDLLQDTDIQTMDFFEIAPSIDRGDFVFLDPPYTVSHNDNGFIKYNKRIFSLDDQVKLRTLLDEINMREAFFLMSNAHHPQIVEIFKGYHYEEVSRQSLIGGRNSFRGKIQEYLFVNYNIRTQVGEIL